VALALPPWCRRIAGDGSTLVVAPHGGLCGRDLVAPGAGGLRGNDLYTDEIAGALADRLGGSLIVNAAVDRNDLDLNRISEVAERAPWFLELLQAELERILARHPVAQLLVVHGWHVVDPRCDLGIGMRLTAGDDAAAHAARLTVSPAYAAGALEQLRDVGAAHGIRATFGERWPAAHRNNVMQLFRRGRRSGEEGPRHPLAALASAGRVEAVQVELGAPLRWPGPWRERFLLTAEAAFGGASRASVREAGAPATDAVDRPASAGAAPVAVALQALDTAAGEHGLGVVVGLGPMSRDELGARLLLLPGGQRLLLFTGHERIGRRAPGSVGGLAVRACDDGFAVRFRGPVLDVPDACRYFRNEGAQREATVVELELELRFAAHDGGSYGRVEGVARLAGGESWKVGTHGFTDPVLARGAASAARRVRLTASFGAGLGVAATLAASSAESSVQCLTHGAATTHAMHGGCALPTIEPGRLPAPFVIDSVDGPRVTCTPRSHVTILRPAGEGAFTRVTFGAASCTLSDGRDGGGFYEHGEGA